MRLTPQERDRLLVAAAAQLAERRRERGLQLNIPEAIALIADTAVEAARDGLRLEEAVARAREVLGPADVLPGVAEVVTEVKVEAVFEDGTRLAVIPDPIGRHPGHDPAQVPGDVSVPPEAAPSSGLLTDTITVSVVNTASVPITVTSHWHFFEANRRLRFDRAAAYGRHLAVPAGQAVRFEPGRRIEVSLVPFGGSRVMVGFAGLVEGRLDDPMVRAEAIRRVRQLGYLDEGGKQP